MAELWGDALGETIGYRIRHDSVCGPNAKIEVITEGILVRMLHGNRALQGVSCVFFDEFHERSMDSDLSFSLCVCAQREHNPTLRLIVMSATINSLGERVARLLGGCPQIFSEGKMFPVEVKMVGWMEELQTQEAIRLHKLEEKTAEIVRDALLERDGDLLVFLPGEKEIMYTWIYLNNNHGIGDGKVPRTMVGYGQSQVKHGAADLSRKISVMPLYGNLDQEEQDEVLSPPPKGGRKVILSTPIAESSITVPGIRIVIDSGMRRIKQYVPQSNMSYMRTVAISKASADQRKGRAGRVAPGICYRMWHEYEHKHLEENDWPEIVKEDLCSLVLDLAVIGAAGDEEIAALPWVDPPPLNLINHARDVLSRVRGIAWLDDDWRLLPRGRHLGRLPLHPRLSHLVTQMRAKWGRSAARAACDLAACLEEKDIFRGGRKQHGCDLSTRFRAVRDEASQDVLKSLRQRIISASDQMQALLGLNKKAGGKEDSEIYRAESQQIGLMVAWSFPELVAQRSSSRVERPKGRSPLVSFMLNNGSTVKMDAFDRLARADWLAVASVDGEKILWACEIDPAYLRYHGYDVHQPHTHEVFDMDFAEDTGQCFEPPQPFVKVEPINRMEKRIDPACNKAYTFDELEKLCKGIYTPAEIKTYWRNECTPIVEGDTSKPEVAASGYPKQAVPAQVPKSTMEKRINNEEKRIDASNGKAYTFKELSEMCADDYSEEEIEQYWLSCKVQQQYAPETGSPRTEPLASRADEAVAPPGATSERDMASPLNVDMSLRDWLLIVDDHGNLLMYLDAFAENFDTVEQLVGVYTKGMGASRTVDPMLYEDIGIKKVGHKRMFERWFKGIPPA
eukprot:gnl/MRDRNA2_/MRDRNA2_59897_c0_seq1.p1 gnl/MRDRNA2_/MRDRNA2_59897_c0~~gnl/MRDRNA2_/MRDRNA2_59897_c0_seq1.p1  ORF type:complete len:859 (+),score=183.36 gnl/MRDRNA2_/MRDRNA2_59897_c0_seq1:31-2577(+)